MVFKIAENPQELELTSDEVLRLTLDNVKLRKKGHGVPQEEENAEIFGKFLVTTQRIIFNSQSVSFTVDFRSISLHAVSREPVTALYCQFETTGEAEEEEEVREAWFSPENEEEIGHLFRVMNECAILNPDPEDEGNSSDDDAIPGGICLDPAMVEALLNGDGEEDGEEEDTFEDAMEDA